MKSETWLKVACLVGLAVSFLVLSGCLHADIGNMR